MWGALAQSQNTNLALQQKCVKKEKKKKKRPNEKKTHAAGKHDVKLDIVGLICPIESTFFIITRFTIYRRLLQMCYISEHYHI